MSALFDYSPEQQAELDAYRAKLEASTTTLDVSPGEFLDYLKTLSTDELVALEYDHAFREWKQWLEYTQDSQLIGLTIAFMTAKPNLKTVEEATQVIHSVSRNRWLSPGNIDILLKLSDALKFEYEEWLAGCLNLTEAQAARLADTSNVWVWQCLAHNSELPVTVLAAIANSVAAAGEPLDADDKERLTHTKAEILNHPACTEEIRNTLNPNAEVLALVAELAQEAEQDRAFSAEFDDV